ncbi:MAG: hypothetical protein CMK32_08990 [Porticoccaceae bacterium]|nr:hypothetical protein [Porticoccaceae bacterium]
MKFVAYRPLTRVAVVARHLAVTVILLASGAPLAETLTLEIHGVEGALADNIRAHWPVDQVACPVTPQRWWRLEREADRQIAAALKALGYYHGFWHLERMGDGSDCGRVLLNVTQGPATVIERVNITLSGDGQGEPVFTDYLDALPLAPGDRLNHGNYDAIKTELQRRARSQGYFESRFETARLVVDTNANQASVELRFITGPRYKFGAIRFPDTPLSNDLLSRFLPFKPGSPFDSERLIQFQDNLINSQYFDSVSVEQGVPDSEQKIVPIEVALTAKTRFQTRIGAGVSTDTGPRITYSLHNRRMNSRGDTYHIDTQLSGVDSFARFQFEQPGQRPLREKYLWSLGVHQEDTDTALSRKLVAEAARLTIEGENWLQNLSLRFLYEDFDIAGESEATMLLMPGIGWSRSESNHPRYPTHGWRLQFSARGAIEGIASDMTLGQATAEGKVILPLFGGRLLSRVNLGATALDDFSRLPASLRFFAGGDNSVRGYQYESLGPENSQGDVVGGKHLLAGSIEVDHKIWREVALAAFIDAGTAFDTRDFTLHQSAGVGIRWFSPIGPIRFDLAFPLKDGGFRVHLSMGPDL